jgi:hypothetical protein
LPVKIGPSRRIAVIKLLDSILHLHYFIHASAGSNFTDECVRQQCETFTEVNEATNSWSLSDLAMEGAIVQSGKQ